MAKKIIFTFNPGKETRVETHGFEGKTCLKALDEIGELMPEGTKLVRNEKSVKLWADLAQEELDEEFINRQQHLCG